MIYSQKEFDHTIHTGTGTTRDFIVSPSLKKLNVNTPSDVLVHIYAEDYCFLTIIGGSQVFLTCGIHTPVELFDTTSVTSFICGEFTCHQYSTAQLYGSSCANTYESSKAILHSPHSEAVSYNSSKIFALAGEVTSYHTSIVYAFNDSSVTVKSPDVEVNTYSEEVLVTNAY